MLQQWDIHLVNLVFWTSILFIDLCNIWSVSSSAAPLLGTPVPQELSVPPLLTQQSFHTMLSKCHAPQVAPLGHIWSHRRPYRSFRFPVFPIILGIPGPKWMRWVWAKLLLMEGAILNTFYPLVFYETFTLVPFHFLVPVLQIYMYLVLLTW